MTPYRDACLNCADLHQTNEELSQSIKKQKIASWGELIFLGLVSSFVSLLIFHFSTAKSDECKESAWVVSPNSEVSFQHFTCDEHALITYDQRSNGDVILSCSCSK